MSAAAAAVLAAVWVGLQTGHQVGDHIVQTQDQAALKGAPSSAELSAGVHPWAGWRSCAGHVATYVATQAVALVLVGLVAQLTVAGVVAALAWSGATHAVIDRRWIVRWWLARKGSTGWAEGPYLVDQSAHHGALLIAAVFAATVTTILGVVGVVGAAAMVVAAGLVGERKRAAAVRGVTR